MATGASSTSNTRSAPIRLDWIVFAMFVIWLTWRNQTHARHGKTGSLRDWFAGECQTWQCRLTGREAATQVLLPIAAVAFGMLAIGIVLLLVEHGVV